MKKWLVGIRSAVLMGLVWAVVWAPIAVLVGLSIVDPDNSHDEMWVVIGAYPGFLCAVVFSAVLAIADRGRRLDELPFGRVGMWGALAGVLVGVFPFTVGTATSAVPFWRLFLSVVASITLMSALSALASAWVARTVKRRGLRDARPDMA